MARKRFVNNRREATFLDVLANINETNAALMAEKSRVAQVEKLTCIDLKNWVPGHVSTATAQIYNIKKSEVAQIKSRAVILEEYDMMGDPTETFKLYQRRGRNAGKGNVRVSSNGAETLSCLTFSFKGAKHASWTTRAGKQAKVPKARKIIKKNGRKYSIPKPYVTNVETYKGKRTPINPRGQNRVFVMSGQDGTLRAVHMRPGDKRPLAHGSSSLPQAIMNKDVVAIWRPQMNEYIQKRITHHDKQTAKNASYFKAGWWKDLDYFNGQYKYRKYWGY